MGMIRFLFSFPWGTLTTSTSVAVVTCIAIVGLGAPPAILVPVLWGSMTVYEVLHSRLNERLDRR
jgi:hypothetical protein